MGVVGALSVGVRGSARRMAPMVERCHCWQLASTMIYLAATPARQIDFSSSCAWDQWKLHWFLSVPGKRAMNGVQNGSVV